MVAAAELRQAVHDYVYSNYQELRPPVDVTTLTTVGNVDYLNFDDDGWSRGDIVEVQATGEQILLRQEDETHGWKIVRGYSNTAVGALPDDSLVTRSPRFTISQVDRALVATLDDMEREQVYTFGHTTFRPGQTIRVPGFIEFLSAYYYRRGHLIPIPVKSLGFGNTIPEEVDSTVASRLEDYEYNIVYKRKIIVPEDLMPRQQWIVVPGAVAWLMSQSVVPATADPGRRADRTVSPGQELRDSINLRKVYEDMCRKEAQLLKSEAARQPGTMATEQYQRWRN